MTRLEDALEECLNRLSRGEATLEACIASYPEHADELRHLVTVAGQLERGQNIRLSGAFKARLRAQVIAHANAHPHTRASAWWDNVVSFRFMLGRAFNFVSGVAAIILLFLLTGTVLAQRALPGQALYPWKLASEQMLRILHPDPLKVDLLVAEHRIEDFTRVVGTPQAEAVALHEYQEALAELSYYSDPQDKQYISESLLQQRANLEQAQLNVPVLDQFLSEINLQKTGLQLDYTAEVIEEGDITYSVTIINKGPAAPITATLIYSFSPAETLEVTGGANCNRFDKGVLVCDVADISTDKPRNLLLTAAIDPCYFGIITSTVTLIGADNVVNINPNNRMEVNTTITSGYSQVAYVQSNGRTHDLGLVAAEDIYPLHLRAAAPAWSPDGSQLAFFGEEGISELGADYAYGNGVWLIDVVNTQAQNPRQLVAVDHIKNIAWSPDGSKLAFEVNRPGMPANVVVVDATDGGQISEFPGAQPAWSPDSRKLAIRNCAPGCGLWQVNFDGSDLEQITTDSSDSYPAWSLTGQYLAFASQQRDDNWEIYSLRLSDNQIIRLTDRAATDTTPVFGVCGQDLYLRTDHYGAWWITVMKLDGSDERQVKEGIGTSDDWGLARPAVR